MRPILASLLAIAACAAADAAPPAPGACGDGPCAACADTVFAEIDLAKLQQLVAAKQVVLLDVNGSASFAQRHIPGAIDFAANQADLVKVLPADKAALIVAYCGGPQCPAWKQGALAASKLGYTNIRHFKGGIAGWSEAKPTAN